MLSGRLLGAAVVAEVGAVGDAPLTIYANHGGTSTGLVTLFLPLDTIKRAKKCPEREALGRVSC
jgi:hypothetical protein